MGHGREFDALVHSIRSTALGTFLVVESGARLVGIRIGLPSEDAAREAVAVRYPHSKQARSSRIASLLDRYFAEKPVDFSDVLLDDTLLTPFQDAVVRACRTVLLGETTTYARLATQAGRPGAMRAVGTVMANNRWPIVVPCHRVLRSDGKVGGFSAPRGTDLKLELLEMERRQRLATLSPPDGGSNRRHVPSGACV